MAPAPSPSTRLFVIRARAAPRAVIFRRGPTNQVLLLSWRMDTDVFEEGQWLKGRLYERRSDLSPSGNHLVYFAAKHKTPLKTWTAVSRPPWLTAVALWPKGDTWGGGGLWEGDDRLQLNHSPSHTKLAEGIALPKRVVISGIPPLKYAGLEDPLWQVRLARDGWTCTSRGEAAVQGLDAPVWITFDPPMVWEKPRPRHAKSCLRMIVRGVRELNGPWYVTDHEVDTSAGTLSLPDTSWADWDTNGDLLYARDGGLFRFALGKQKTARQLIDLSPLRFEQRVAPAWAQRW